MDNANKSSSHAVFNIKLHIVLVTKYRRKTLTPELLDYLKEAFADCLAASVQTNLAADRFVAPLPCLLLRITVPGTQEAFQGASCTSLQRSAMFRAKSGQSGS